MAQSKHAAIERSVFLMIVLTLLTVSVGGLVEIVPLFFQKSTTSPIDQKGQELAVKPYDPVRLVGRDVYIREGCYNCHSQMIRPFRLRPNAMATIRWRVSPSTTIRSSGVRSVPAPTWPVLAVAIPTNGTAFTC